MADTETVQILLVEDDEDDYVMTRDLLEDVVGTRYELCWAATYELGLNKIHEQDFDVHLFDYRLGARTGLELLEACHQAGSSVPVIMLTGQSNHATDLQAMQAGAADYLIKGQIDPDQLERAIRYALQRARADRQISHLAFYDALTGLPNRVLFKERLHQSLLRQTRTGAHCAVLFMDIDEFKRINDTLGHADGDLLLMAVSDRLQRCLRCSDTLTRIDASGEDQRIFARLGGDEFTVMLPDVDCPEDASFVAKRILAALDEPFRVGKHDVYVGASIGIAVAPTDGNSVDDLLRNADTAMYQVKGDGKNGFKFFEPCMHAGAVERLNLESRLRKAIERDELVLHYQPQFAIPDRRLIGLEALVRWRTPQGLISPGRFIPLAEETGLILDIGNWVLEEACAQMHRWRASGYQQVRMSVNLAGAQFEQPGLQMRVAQALEKSGLAPRQLMLEITEGTLMRHRSDTQRRIQELKDLGVGFALDDFGTGYSSLSYLKRFALTAVKIDRSFVAGLGRDPKDAAIVAAIIAMAQGLELEAIAEGVETSEQWNFLAKLGCGEAQGFLLARPEPAEEVQARLEIASEQKQYVGA